MKRLLVLFVVVLMASVAMASSARIDPAADQPVSKITFTDAMFGNAEPFVALNPDGSGLIMISRAVSLGYVPERDDTTAAFRAAVIRNPDVDRQLVAHVFKSWTSAGKAQGLRNDSIIIRNQRHYNVLAADMRARVQEVLGSYVSEIEQMLSPEQLLELATAPDVDPSNYTSLPSFTAAWYTPPNDDIASVRGARLDYWTSCRACEKGEKPAAICGGWCVKGCIHCSWDCTVVVVVAPAN